MPNSELPHESESGADTKVCPYCAETIKAAAIRCRFCQSDLSDAPVVAATPLSPLPPPSIEPVEPGVDLSEPGDIGESERKGRSGADPAPTSARTMSRGVLVGLLVLSLIGTLAFLVLAFRDYRHAKELRDAQEAGRTAQAAVVDEVKTLLSYDFTKFDDNLTEAKKVMTERFAKEYEPTAQEIRSRAIAQRRSQTADVRAASVVSQTTDKVQTLVFVDVASTKAGSNKQQLMQNRIDVTLVRADGRWLIDDVTVPTS